MRGFADSGFSASTWLHELQGMAPGELQALAQSSRWQSHRGIAPAVTAASFPNPLAPEPEPEPEPEPTPAASAASGKAQTPPDALPRDLGGLLNKEAQSKSEDAVGDFLDALGGGGSEEVLVGQASLRCAPLKSALIVQLLG